MRKFFDRKEACKKISDIIHQINEGMPAAVWIEGQSGVGKTRFVEYICEHENEINFFTFSSGDIFYKCERGAEGSSFEYIAALVYEIQHEDPRFFELFIQNYFDNLEHISFLDACCLIIPQIKGLKAISSLIETKYNKISTMQGKISERLVTYQLINLFSDMILAFFKDTYKDGQVVLCIDDAQWLDSASLRVIESIIKKSRFDSCREIVSVFLTIRDKDGLSNEEYENYQKIFRTVSNLFINVSTIYLYNFDLKTTSEIIQDTERYYLIENIPIIYKITSGNPMELEQTLRFSDKRIRDILNRTNKTATPRDNTFSEERITELYYKKTIYAVILNVLSILRRHASVNLLYKCIVEIYSNLINDICLYSEYLDAIEYLIENDYICRNSYEADISLKHDSIYHTVLNYISENGDYVTYSKTIAKTLLKTQNDTYLKETAQKLLALKLLSEVDAKLCLEQFISILFNSNKQLELDFYITGAIAFLSDLSNQNKVNSKIIANFVLPKLVSSSTLEISRRICHTLCPHIETLLSVDEQITFLMNYLKTQIDLSNINNNDEAAVPLFEKLNKYNCNNTDSKVQILLLGMATYEHILNHKKILELYHEAEKIILDNYDQLSYTTLALFYRNKGLCFPHSDLQTDYFKAIKMAENINNYAYRHLICGTCMNNLGLTYFYKGEIENAYDAFSECEKHLSSVGYNTARVHNNMGVCYYMLHDIENAYKQFSIAASSQTEGVFMKLCIQTNLALSLFFLNKAEKAKKILDILIKEYTIGNQRSTDTLVYCAAMINRGYIAFLERDYFFAADCYQKSLIHTYRYQNKEQLQKREMMRNISLQKGMGEKTNTEMDIKDELMDFYKKPYSLVPFAFYVI